jgi:regulator of replication initiation timing
VDGIPSQAPDKTLSITNSLQTRLANLERANKLLAAQNDALRSALGSQPQKTAAERPPREESGRDEGSSTQALARWEADKKLTKRVATLEKRLKEHMEEYDSMAEKLANTRDNFSHVQLEKESIQRKYDAIAMRVKQVVNDVT